MRTWHWSKRLAFTSSNRSGRPCQRHGVSYPTSLHRIIAERQPLVCCCWYCCCPSSPKNTTQFADKKSFGDESAYRYMPILELVLPLWQRKSRFMLTVSVRVVAIVYCNSKTAHITVSHQGTKLSCWWFTARVLYILMRLYRPHNQRIQDSTLLVGRPNFKPRPHSMYVTGQDCRLLSYNST